MNFGSTNWLNKKKKKVRTHDILAMVGPGMIFYNGPMIDITFLSINSSLPMICCEINMKILWT